MAEAEAEAEAEEEAVEEVHIHVLPGTQVYLFNEEAENKGRRRLVVHYYVEKLKGAERVIGDKDFAGIFKRFYRRLGFRFIVIRIDYLLRVDDEDLVVFKGFANDNVKGCSFVDDPYDRQHNKTSLSRIDFFQQTRDDSRPVRARALGTIVYDPMLRVEAQIEAQEVHYKHELLYFLSENPQPLTLQEWQCLGHLKRGHDSNFITFVFKLWPTQPEEDTRLTATKKKVQDFMDSFQYTIRGREARAMAAAVGFKIRKHMAFAFKLENIYFPLYGRMFRSLHDSDDIVTPAFPPNHYSRRHPDLRLEHHHVYHVYPLRPKTHGRPDSLHVLDFPETTPLFAPHLKVVLHLFYHYLSHLVEGFGQQDVETLRQFMFGADPVPGVAPKYHRVVIHPVMYSRPIRSFLQSPGVSLVNSRTYPGGVEVAKFDKLPIPAKKERITLYIYPGTRMFCQFREKPLRKSHVRHLYIFYYVSDLKQSKEGLGSKRIQQQVQANFRDLRISMVHMRIIYMGRPHPLEALDFRHIHYFDFPLEFVGRTQTAETAITHISSMTLKGKGSGRHAYATGVGFSDPVEALEDSPYFQDCLVYLTTPSSALTYQEWAALADLRSCLRGEHGRSRVTLVLELPFVRIDKVDGVIERVIGPAARTLAKQHGFELQPYLAYPMTSDDFLGRSGCIFSSIQKTHNYAIPPINGTNPNYYIERQPGEQVEFHYSYHLYPRVDGTRIPLKVSLLPGRKTGRDEHCRRILHLLYHYPPDTDRDAAFEQQTNSAVQKYVEPANPYTIYHEVRSHIL